MPTGPRPPTACPPHDLLDIAATELTERGTHGWANLTLRTTGTTGTALIRHVTFTYWLPATTTGHSQPIGCHSLWAQPEDTDRTALLELTADATLGIPNTRLPTRTAGEVSSSATRPATSSYPPASASFSLGGGSPPGSDDVDAACRAPVPVGVVFGRGCRAMSVPSVPVDSKGQRRADRALVAAYHEARLGELIECVAAEVDRFRAGEVDAYTVDEVLHHYHLAAKELWKFCWSGSGAQVEFTARALERLAADGERIDWWERAAPRRRE